MKKYFLLLFVLCVLSCKKKENSFPSILNEYIKDSVNSRLIDFSYAGYHLGTEYPNFTDTSKKILYVVDFGAIPNDGKDDIDAIQTAIDSAAKLRNTVIKFPSGVFDFDVNTQHRFLKINHSGIILLGNGDGTDGTVLYDHHSSSYPDPNYDGLANRFPSFIFIGKIPSDTNWSPVYDQSNLVAHLKPAKRNRNCIEVSDVSKLEVGKTYLLTQEDDKDTSLVNALTFPLTKVGKNFLDTTGTRKYKIQQMVSIVKIEDTKIILDAPLMCDLRVEWSPKLWKIDSIIEEVGVLGFTMKTDWNEVFIHHSSSIHDDGWNHISMNWTENCWIQSIHHQSATRAIGIENGKNNSIWDCRISGLTGHIGFYLGGCSTRNLFYYLQGSKAFHTFSIRAYVSGNVFHNCYSDEPSSIDCHGGIGIYNLFDNMYGGVFKNGGSKYVLPPTMGVNTVFWNWKMGCSEPYRNHLKNSVVEMKDVAFAMYVGVKGKYGQTLYFIDGNKKRTYGNKDNDSIYITNLNQEVWPHSIYNFQMMKRNGRPLP